MIRNAYAGKLRKENAGQEVTLAGWVARRRDHGGVAFIDLRDISGSVQVVINDEKIAGSLRAEWCVLVKGKVGFIAEIIIKLNETTLTNKYEINIGLLGEYSSGKSTLVISSYFN